ncbi:DUF4013 domain-containing protein [Thermophilibacter immobilis]|jgi:hypothetical protein|uniref:DUF4013 domain-containing protein n=1 Tax=Thermophilibacter immobilis TaxID=2779519 RepID=A0A7S7M8E9_9ACTN|nr:DUF4013 domain-containing protein [Thermophilibacter immobilis]QOY60666.1 DUF4013 domain-containing protein [Thermophilibacter immobilis]
MVTENELEGFRRDRYFARSWALLTRDKGWIKPVLLLTLAMLVPFVGWLGLLGYAAEWARLTAWGVNSAPKQKGVRVGECIASGWRVFLVLLVWGIGMGVIGWIVGTVPLLNDLLSFAWSIFCVFLGLVTIVASLRATIYQKFGAGMRLKTIWEMASHDAGGLIRIIGMQIIGGAIVGVVTFFILLTAFMSVMPHIVYVVDMFTEYDYLMSSSMRQSLIIELVTTFLSSMGPAILVMALLENFAGVLLSLLSYTAVGLWMRQFNVPLWGRDEDPLPPFLMDPREQQGSYQQPPQPGYQPAGPGDGNGSQPPAQPQPQAPAAPAPAAPMAPAPLAMPAPAPDPEPPVSGAPAPAPQSAPVEKPAQDEVPVPGEGEPLGSSDEIIEVTPLAVAPTSELPTPSEEPSAPEPPAEGDNPIEETPVPDGDVPEGGSSRQSTK